MKCHHSQFYVILLSSQSISCTQKGLGWHPQREETPHTVLAILFKLNFRGGFKICQRSPLEFYLGKKGPKSGFFTWLWQSFLAHRWPQSKKCKSKLTPLGSHLFKNDAAYLISRFLTPPPPKKNTWKKVIFAILQALKSPFNSNLFIEPRVPELPGQKCGSKWCHLASTCLIGLKFIILPMLNWSQFSKSPGYPGWVSTASIIIMYNTVLMQMLNCHFDDLKLL